MKIKAEPCLKNYLTVHVTPSKLINERVKKQKINADIFNPLLNKKLQLNKQANKNSHISIIYSRQPNKLYEKKKKLQSIPLLSHIKINSTKQFRVAKDVQKSGYNFIFKRSQSANNLLNDINLKNKYHRRTPSPHRLYQSNKCLSHHERRNSDIQLLTIHSQNHHNGKQSIQNIYQIKQGLNPCVQVNGIKANYSKSMTYWRRKVKQDDEIFVNQQKPKQNIQIFL